MPLIALLLLAIALPAWAGDPCFDLSTRIAEPPRPGLPLPPSGSDVSDAGQKGELVWAQRRGVVRRPIEKLRAFLEDPRNFKDEQVAEMTLTPLPSGPQLERHRVRSLVRPFPFVTVEWTDEWATTLVAGTPARPDVLVVAYQKVAGTSYIAHFCGTLVLTRIDDHTTDVAQYEEANITGRSHDDMKRGLAEFVDTMRSLP